MRSAFEREGYELLLDFVVFGTFVVDFCGTVVTLAEDEAEHREERLSRAALRGIEAPHRCRAVQVPDAHVAK